MSCTFMNVMCTVMHNKARRGRYIVHKILESQVNKMQHKTLSREVTKGKGREGLRGGSLSELSCMLKISD